MVSPLLWGIQLLETIYTFHKQQQALIKPISEMKGNENRFHAIDPRNGTLYGNNNKLKTV